MSFYPVYGMIETLFMSWGNSNKNERRDGEVGKTNYHVSLRGRGKLSILCLTAWIRIKGDREKSKIICMIQATVKLSLTWDHPPNVHYDVNVNSQYLPSNESYSVSIFQAPSQGQLLEIWSLGPESGAWRGQMFDVFEAGDKKYRKGELLKQIQTTELW